MSRRIQIGASISEESLNEIKEIMVKDDRSLSYTAGALIEQALAERKRQREKNRKKPNAKEVYS